MKRRELLMGLFTAPFSSSPLSALAQAVDHNTEANDSTIVGALPPLPTDLAGRDREAPFQYVETGLVGSGVPSHEEVDTAYGILLKSPFGVPPIEVARYFLAIGEGEYGAKLRPFAREWPVRANPVIFHFFSATQTSPEGDTTAWCAAFLNWCLLRARATKAEQIGKSPGSFSRGGELFDIDSLRHHSTNSASSGSFRCWDSTSQPVHGDIVVFADKGTHSFSSSCRGTGHVAFFLDIPSAGKVRVLGGNQAFSGSGGAVTVADQGTGSGSRFFKYTKPR